MVEARPAGALGKAEGDIGCLPQAPATYCNLLYGVGAAHLSKPTKLPPALPGGPRPVPVSQFK